jgi:hypothetical protein
MSNYQWTVTPGGTVVAGGGPTNNSITITWTTAGIEEITVNYTAPNGCTAVTPTVKYITVNPAPLNPITPTTGIEERPAALECNVYPVPNDGRFKLTIGYPGKSIFNVSIYNNLGMLIYEIPEIEVDGRVEEQIDLFSATRGVYTIVIRNADEHVIKRILINR